MLPFQRGPLQGVRIFDLSRLLPGPFATQILRDLGAEVTKIENSDTGGDPIRSYEPKAADGNSAMFHAINRGKKSISFSFRGGLGKEKLEGILANADVLVESFRPGTLEKILGVDNIEATLSRHPRLIIARISGYGQKQPQPGHDLNFMADAGVLGMMVEPTAAPLQYADIAGGAWPAALQVS